MLSVHDALVYTAVMAPVIFACRAAPFAAFGTDEGPADGRQARRSFARACADFAERAAPPAAMTVLAVNAAGGEIAAAPHKAPAVLAACAVTALLHVWKRSALLSISCGTAAYCLLS